MESKVKRMWSKINNLIKKYWKWLVTGLGAILAIILLGRRHGSTTSNIAEKMKDNQAGRLREAEEVNKNIQKDIKRADEIMSDYYKKKSGR